MLRVLNGVVRNGITRTVGRLLAIALILSPSAAAQDDGDDFAGGLQATFHVGDRTFQRIDTTLSFDWDNGVPDGRVGDDGFSVEWKGKLLVRQPGQHTFYAHLTGQVAIEIDGDTALEANGSSNFVSGMAVPLSAGDHSVVVTFQAPDRSDSASGHPRLHVFWSSENFTLEPLPAELLFHEEPDASLRQQDRGRLLTDAFRCAACHRNSAAMPAPAAPSLERIAGSHVDDSLVKRLMKPGDVVANSHMPDFGLSRDQAAAVAAFLLSVSKDAHPEEQVPLEDGDRDAGRKLLNSLGCVACHKLPGVDIDNTPLAEPYDGPDLTRVGERRSAPWLERWLREPASLNSNHRMPVFDLDNKRRQLVAALLASNEPVVSSAVTTPRSSRGVHALTRPAEDDIPADAGSIGHVADADGQIALGKRIVEQANCAACHHIPRIEPRREIAEPLTKASLSADGHRCLHAQPTEPQANSHLPQFAFSDSHRESITAWLKSVDRPLQPAGSFERGELLLLRNACLACHDRNASRGVSTVAAQLQNTHPELNGQSQALIPPPLTAIGDKLTNEFLNKAVAGEQSERRLPWLLVQMPKFKHTDLERTDLVHHLVAADRIPDAADPARQDVLAHVNSPAANADTQHLLVGNQLTGAAGFNCVACHKAGAFEPRNVAPGTRGSDLMTMGQRIRPRFFQRWMKNPLRVVAGIEMPAIQKAVPGLDNDSLPRQLATVWQALADARFTPPTVTSRFEQVVNVAPGGAPRVIRDVFTIGEGRDRQAVARAMAIGFSNGHNILIDLDTMQIRQWTIGEFARQRTEGKSWYWDMAGITVATPEDLRVPWQLIAADASRTLLPVPDESQTAELVEYRTLPNAVELITRFRFDPSESTNPHSLSDEPHFTTPRWRDPDRPLEAVTVRHRFEPTGQQAGESGWTHTVELIDGPPGWQPVAARFRPARTSDSTNAVWTGSIVQTPDTDTIALNRGQRQTFENLTPAILPPTGSFTMPPEISTMIEAITTTPGFDGQRLPLPASIMPTSIAWLPDNRMVFTSLKGHVWIAADTDGDGLHDSLTLFEEGLAAPFGIVPDGDSIIVAHKPEILRLTDTNGDGRADLREVFAAGWGYNDNYHDWTTGLIRDDEGNFFAGLGSDYSQNGRPKNQDRWRGGVIKIDPSGNVTPVAMSFRYPMGLAFDAHGNLWATDNQGVQNTFNEINHILPGKHYGVPSSHQPTEQLQHEEPGLMIPHPWVRSMNSILFLPDHYAVESLRGHGIGCEYDNRMLIRFTVQNVAGVLQGASYNFSRPDSGGGGSNFIGPICSTLSPDGAIYIGSIWDSGWQGGQNNGGITRLIPSADGMPNGIREVQATPTGFEVDFFQPVDRAFAANPESWSIQGYTRVWGGNYATPDSGRHTLTASNIQLSKAGTRVRFDVQELRPAHMYDITVIGGLPEGAEMFPSEAHYSMKVVPK